MKGDKVMYTISELATLSGVTTRTLRYYDQIGLVPAQLNESGHRVYTQEAVDLLQQVLFYRELDVELKTIRQIVQEPDFSIQDALAEQYEALEAERNRLNRLLKTLEQTIQAQKGDRVMSNEEKFSAFKAEMVAENENQYGTEIRENYGDETVDASNLKLMGMSEETYQAFLALEKEIKHDLLLAAVQTQNVASDEAKILVEKHREWLCYTWPTYSPEAHRGLADMYVEDERFTAYYDDLVPGGTLFLRDAINMWAEK